jgi:hypothetical protein
MNKTTILMAFMIFMSLPIAFVLAKKGLIKSCDGYGKGVA